MRLGLAPALALLVPLLGPVPARSQVTPSPASTGRRVVSLAEYGATNGRDSLGRVVDNGPILQRAIDDLKAYAGRPPRPGTVLLDDVYNCWSPAFLDMDGLTIRPSGPARSGGFRFYTSGPGLVVVKRDPGGLAHPTDARVDSFGIADASLAPRPGAWRGYRTAPPSQPDAHVHAAAPWTTLTLGRDDDGHAGTRRFTVEVLLATPTPPGNGLADSRPLFGAAEGRPVLGQVPVGLGLAWATVGGTYEYRLTAEDGVVRRLPIPAADKGAKAAPGPVRLCWQVDLDAGTTLLFRDGLRVAPPAGTPDLPAGLRLLPSEYAPFNLGGVDFYTLAFGGGRPDNGDFAYHGFKITDDLVYADVPVGQPQKRLDGRDVNDLTRFGRDAKSLGAFRGDLVPASPLLVPFACADRAGSIGMADAHLLSYAASASRVGNGTPYAVVGLRLEGLTVAQSGSNRYNGAALATLDVRDLRIVDCAFNGGAYGIAGLQLNTNAYPLYLDRTTFQGGDCGLAAVGWHAWLRDCSVPYAGRYGAILHGSTIDWDGGWWGANDWARTLAFWRLKSGTGVPVYSLRHIAIDNEVPTRGMLGVVWSDAVPRTRIELDNVDLYQASPDTRLAYLGDGAPGTRARLAARNCLQTDSMRAVVTVAGVHGPRWSVTLDGFEDGRPAGEPWEVAAGKSAPDGSPGPWPATVPVEFRDGADKTATVAVTPAPAASASAPPPWPAELAPTAYARSTGRPVPAPVVPTAPAPSP